MASENIVCTDGKNPGEFSSGRVCKKPKSWMKYLQGTIHIGDLVVFGSHNSCDNKYQKLPILDQLKNGVRFLDLHLTFYESKVCVFRDGGHIHFLDVLNDIQIFVQNFTTETVIIYLQDAQVGGVDWAGIKGIIPEPMKAMFVPKRDLNMELKDARSSMILFAPEALDMEINWGSSLIETHLAPADVTTRPKLNSFLKDVIAKKLSKVKLVWVEIRLRGDSDKVKDFELMEACDLFIPRAKDFNILTFTFVDETHFVKDLQFSLLKV